MRQRLLWLVSRPVLSTLRPCPSRSAAMPRDTHHAQAHQKIISPRGLESKPDSLHASSLGVTGGKGRQGPVVAAFAGRTKLPEVAGETDPFARSPIKGRQDRHMPHPQLHTLWVNLFACSFLGVPIGHHATRRLRCGRLLNFWERCGR